MKKNKMIYMPKLNNAYIKAMLGHHPKKYPADFVETLIDERKKQLTKEKHYAKTTKV